ncbi:MAG: hypothetical protein RIC55_27235 [Pirellulaceae bacterium]
MWPPFQTIRDLREGAEVLRRRPYGVIETADERLVGIHLRPWPKVISVAEIWWLGSRFHHRTPGNRCLLYYNQPWGFRNFLTLKYVVSSCGASLKTFRGALVILDEIARIKRSDAALCEASNLRISDRLLDRWGWQRHVPDSDRRHFIKRFYGDYPAPQEAWDLCGIQEGESVCDVEACSAKSGDNREVPITDVGSDELERDALLSPTAGPSR